MESFCIDYKETGAFNPLVLSYLDHEEKLAAFHSGFPSIATLTHHTRQRRQPADRLVLTEVLQDQYSRCARHNAIDPAVTENISSLASPATFTITTGHQLSLFTGPLFFLYKIVSAINLAKQLSDSMPENHYVPVYWMATEDHDFAEINHLTLAGEKLSWDLDAGGATGRLSTSSTKEIVSEYVKLIGESAAAGELAAWVENAYLQESTLADATRSLVNALFGKYGVVVMDADDPRLKKQFAPYIVRDLLEKNSYRIIAESTDALEKAGYNPRVNAREINFFYLTAGSRERIEFRDGTYAVLNSTLVFTEEALKVEIAAHPERFSPNVMLRPLYQEVILPNIAYIGGGAEVAYWLQLKATFDYYRIDFPVLVLRNSALILGPDDAKILSGYGLSVSDLFLSRDALAKKWVLQNTHDDLTVTGERNELAEIFLKLKNRVSALDSTLGPSTEAIHARLEHALDNLQKKVLKAEKRKQAQHLRDLFDLRNRLFPGNTLQERKDNIGDYFPLYGAPLIDELVCHLHPLDEKFTILQPASGQA